MLFLARVSSPKQSATMRPMNNQRPLSILFLALVLAVVPLSAALLIHGHANVQAVFQNAFG